jgi:mono/diheme cytochrome c family protein
MRAWLSHIVVFVLLLATVFAGCAQEDYPASALLAKNTPGGGSPDASTAQDSLHIGTCSQALAQTLPARLATMTSPAGTDGGADAGPAGTLYLVNDLLDRFKPLCAPCHGAQVAPSGNFQVVTTSDFTAKVTSDVLSHITSDAACPWKTGDADPEPMPPCGYPNAGPYSKRSATDPLFQFAELVRAWVKLGSPDTFHAVLPGEDTSGGGAAAGPSATATYLFPPAMADAMTNLGTCIPTHGIVAYEKDKSLALDMQFAAAVADPNGSSPDKQLGLPLHLKDTDLFTLDSKTLAAYGVVAFAPAYPLWSDDAGKLRYVRVPRGTSIRFDKATQKFDIPANTRFYKTFLKQIIDTDGSYRYRKIETRLIVSRPSTIGAEGSNTTHALYGSYRWTDDETDAVLVTTPLNNGLPFADTLLQYTTDEQLAADILKSNPEAPEKALLDNHAARHYAIPSAGRCVDCHQGSASESFVLGFAPLQIMRRATGEGGTYEATGPDELTQLQRLIDYGIVTGVDSPDDILPLERSEGDRTPRNAYELKAQAYMLGNCSHCHNPNGLATLQNPILKDFNFLPAANSGIFQFPLERYSPRLFRGASGTTQIPYITPSLLDQPTYDENGGTTQPDPFFIVPDADEKGVVHVEGAFYAPWRSLIYRNVDNPFPYTYDHVFFPHMPMNTQGYDPRVKQIVSDWMVSIPSVRKRPDLAEYAFFPTTPVDQSPQPYVEVTPDQPGYDDAKRAADERLAILHGADNPQVPDDQHLAFVRYQDPGQTDDIVDPVAEFNPCSAPPPGETGAEPHSSRPNATTAIPGHCNWVVTDLTLPPADWQPRRPDWEQVLIEGRPSPAPVCPAKDTNVAIDRAMAESLLPSVHFTDEFKTWATTPVPFGLWLKKSQCTYPAQKTAGAPPYTQHWMNVVAGIAPTDPLYEQSPGQAVFNTICVNCHGPKADGTGRMALNLEIMTGGLGRVADFRDGLFGPLSAPGSAMQRVFGALDSDALAADGGAAWSGATVDERAARYMAWMGLGGTQVNIPKAILDVVGTTRVLGQPRVVGAFIPSANMLSLAKTICHDVLGPAADHKQFSASVLGNAKSGYLDSGLSTSLITSNGDAELWLRLCSIGNPPPVRVVELASQVETSPGTFVAYAPSLPEGAAGALLQFVRPEVYPTGVPIGNERGAADAGMSTSNQWPWCLDSKSASAGDKQAAIARGAPPCPRALYTDDTMTILSSSNAWAPEDVERWTVRGAINAGLAVFLYLQQLEGHDPQPTYDSCELLH